MTDPSYAGQIITFTFPHIGNVGANPEDIETIDAGGARPGAARRHHRAVELARGAALSTPGSNRNGLVGIAGIDTRPLTRRIRDGGAPNGALCHAPDGRHRRRRRCSRRRAPGPGSKAWISPRRSRCRQSYTLGRDRAGARGKATAGSTDPRFHVVAVDYGAKRNILRMPGRARLRASPWCRRRRAPTEILRHKPDGIFLVERPGRSGGDRRLCRAGDPQALIGERQADLRHLPRPSAPGAGAGRPDAQDGDRPSRRQSSGQGSRHRQGRDHQPESRLRASLPGNAARRRRGDACLAVRRLQRGARASTDRPVFSVQYHPEASPGPQDSHYLFERFVDMIEHEQVKQLPSPFPSASPIDSNA